MDTAFDADFSTTLGDAGAVLAIPGINVPGAAGCWAVHAESVSAATVTSKTCFIPTEFLMHRDTRRGYVPAGGTSTSTTPRASRTSRCGNDGGVTGSWCTRTAPSTVNDVR